MSNIIKLLAVSILLVGCKGMYDKNYESKKMSDAAVSKVEKHPAKHVNNVATSTADRASTVSNMYKNR